MWGRTTKDRLQAIRAPTGYGPYTHNMDNPPFFFIKAPTTSHPTLSLDASTAPCLPSLSEPMLNASLVSVGAAVKALEIEHLAFDPNYSTQPPRHKKVALLTSSIIASMPTSLLATVFTNTTLSNPTLIINAIKENIYIVLKGTSSGPVIHCWPNPLR